MHQQAFQTLGSSPDTVAKSPLVVAADLEEAEGAEMVSSSSLNLETFVAQLPQALQEAKEYGIPAGTMEDPIMQLFSRLHLSPQDYMPYAHFDTSRNYTRNLVATDHATFTLLLLCWNPLQQSPIHDHPCDGCWMQCLQGQMLERRFVEVEQMKKSWSGDDDDDDDDENDNDDDLNYSDTSGPLLQCVQETMVYKNDLVFITDALGFHQVGNPTETQAVTLHLYCPPFQSCRLWLQADRPPCQSQICYYSEYGEILKEH